MIFVEVIAFSNYSIIILLIDKPKISLTFHRRTYATEKIKGKRNVSKRKNLIQNIEHELYLSSKV